MAILTGCQDCFDAVLSAEGTQEAAESPGAVHPTSPQSGGVAGGVVSREFDLTQDVLASEPSWDAPLQHALALSHGIHLAVQLRGLITSHGSPSDVVCVHYPPLHSGPWHALTVRLLPSRFEGDLSLPGARCAAASPCIIPAAGTQGSKPPERRHLPRTLSELLTSSLRMAERSKC